MSEDEKLIHNTQRPGDAYRDTAKRQRLAVATHNSVWRETSAQVRSGYVFVGWVGLMVRIVLYSECGRLADSAA